MEPTPAVAVSDAVKHRGSLGPLGGLRVSWMTSRKLTPTLTRRRMMIMSSSTGTSHPPITASLPIGEKRLPEYYFFKIAPKGLFVFKLSNKRNSLKSLQTTRAGSKTSPYLFFQLVSKNALMAKNTKVSSMVKPYGSFLLYLIKVTLSS